MEFAGALCCGDRRVAVVRRGQQRPIAMGGDDLGVLLTGWRQVSVVGVRLLLRGRPGRQPADAAVVAHAARIVVVDDGAVVHVGYVNAAEVIHGVVVGEVAMIPVAALVSDAAIPEAVIDAAVEADGQPPVSCVPGIRPIIPAPVAGRPQQTGSRRQGPGAGHPIIAGVAIRPITGGPDVAGRRDRRLLIDGQRRRRDRGRRDSDVRRVGWPASDLRERCGRKDRQRGGCKQNWQEISGSAHVVFLSHWWDWTGEWSAQRTMRCSRRKCSSKLVVGDCVNRSQEIVTDCFDYLIGFMSRIRRVPRL